MVMSRSTVSNSNGNRDIFGETVGPFIDVIQSAAPHMEPGEIRLVMERIGKFEVAAQKQCSI